VYESELEIQFFFRNAGWIFDSSLSSAPWVEVEIEIGFPELCRCFFFLLKLFSISVAVDDVDVDVDDDDITALVPPPGKPGKRFR
jgi:hypothetical protein